MEAYTKLRLDNRSKQIDIDGKVDTKAISNLVPKKVFKKVKAVQLKKECCSTILLVEQ